MKKHRNKKYLEKKLCLCSLLKRENGTAFCTRKASKINLYTLQPSSELFCKSCVFHKPLEWKLSAVKAYINRGEKLE